MEKEQKKLLLVAVSVGVFLLVTVTIAIMLITQRTQPQEASFSAPQPVQVQFNPPVIDPPYVFDSPAVTEEITEAAEDRNEGDLLVIQIPAPVNVAIPDNPEIAAAPAKTQQPAANQAASAPPAPAQPARTQNTAPARTTAATRTVNDYWIQTGAFSARVRAEDAKEKLAEKGLISIIENREVNGQIWYRVRLGPYTSQNEADYWLALVKSIDGFGESQVRQTTRTQ